MSDTKLLGKREQQQLAALIRAAKESATLEHSVFDKIGGTPSDDPLPRSEREVTAFIKRRVRLHHETWIVSPLERALTLLATTKEHKG
jgi:hypothetical protein